MKTYTPIEYIAIDIANAFGKDKLTFENRIQWVKDNRHQLEELTSEAETKPLYVKAVQAFRKVQRGEPTGHLLGLDSVCSGLQIMSVVSGCKDGASITGLVHPDVRADAYTSITEVMNTFLEENIQVSRKDSKKALMTYLYGSRAVPKEVFGEATPQLEAFYKAVKHSAKGAVKLLELLLDSWNEKAKMYAWTLPDGFCASVKVMNKKSARMEIDELNHYRFTYDYYVNEPLPFGLSIAANAIHSIDAYIVRTLQRKCNYDKKMVLEAKALLENGLKGGVFSDPFKEYSEENPTRLEEYISYFIQSGVCDISILPHLVKKSSRWSLIEVEHAERLLEIINTMLVYEPFELVTVHDEFKCHPNYVNHLRQQYINTLVELSKSNIMQSILRQIKEDETFIYEKESNDLHHYIANSNYGIC